MLEQNVDGVRHVLRNGLFFTSRSEPPVVTIDAAGTATTVTIVITVTGQVWFYRPGVP